MTLLLQTSRNHLHRDFARLEDSGDPTSVSLTVLRRPISFTVAALVLVRLVGLSAKPGDAGESPIDNPPIELVWPSLASNDPYRPRSNRLLVVGECEPRASLGDNGLVIGLVGSDAFRAWYPGNSCDPVTGRVSTSCSIITASVPSCHVPGSTPPPSLEVTLTAHTPPRSTNIPRITRHK